MRLGRQVLRDEKRVGSRKFLQSTDECLYHCLQDFRLAPAIPVRRLPCVHDWAPEIPVRGLPCIHDVLPPTYRSASRPSTQHRKAPRRRDFSQSKPRSRWVRLGLTDFKL